jgi:hypothetical protein
VSLAFFIHSDSDEMQTFIVSLQLNDCLVKTEKRIFLPQNQPFCVSTKKKGENENESNTMCMKKINNSQHFHSDVRKE